jgi:hypothetical protein
MENGIFARYKGIEYKANRRGNKIILISENEKEIDKGFQWDSISQVYVLLVDKSELDQFYTKTLCCNYAGDTFIIADEQGDNYLLISGPRSYLLTELGFIETDRGEFQKWVNKNDVTNLVEKLKER